MPHSEFRIQLNPQSNIRNEIIPDSEFRIPP